MYMVAMACNTQRTTESATQLLGEAQSIYLMAE